MLNRKLLCVAAGVVLGLAAVRLATLQGLVFPVRIAGGSMAYVLCGLHNTLVCADCRMPFRCDAEHPPATDLAVCPNCGYHGNPIGDESIRRGERVLIDRLAYLFHPPQRWDLVAFRDTNQELTVKRVVGLPGESVSIRQGDVYINGSIERKSLDQLRRLAILVHDSAFQPADDPSLPSRWRSDEPTSGWKHEAEGFRFVPPPDRSGGGVEQADLDWLSYHHWRCFAAVQPRTEEAPVSDHYGYNQAESRELQNVSDLLLACQVEVERTARLSVRLHDGSESLFVHFEPASGRVGVVRGDERFVSREDARAIVGRSWRLEVGLIDEQVLVSVNQREVVRRPYVRASGPTAPGCQPLAIGASGGTVVVGELRVLRDIYYLAPDRFHHSWESGGTIGADEFFVLGDNAAFSIDSRQRTRSGVSRKSLTGKVLCVSGRHPAI